jgi:hypothetical protein
MPKAKVTPVTKIDYTNDWETEEYFANGEKLTPENCKSLLVKWPDNTVEQISIKWNTVEGTYGDMGHQYEFSRKEMFTTINYKGVKITLNLKDILKFKIKK